MKNAVEVEQELINKQVSGLKKPSYKVENFPLDDEVEVGIHFHMYDMTKEELNKLFQAEKLLTEIGVCFDSGAGLGERDWEWDWSLRGPVHVTFRRMAKDNPKNRYIRETMPPTPMKDSQCGGNPIGAPCNEEEV